ncbi:MAG: hypothetical protein HKO98_15745 [Gemmatimonadetes bacterium]|nr:hypothetical protein [Gemmatimonadota bacterium]
MRRVAVCFVVAGLTLVGGPHAARAQSESSPELAWYGYVKLDASWDEALVNTGNFARWVVSPDIEDPHASLNLTARQTRLGFRVRSEAGNAQLSGLWEADFYAGAAENKNGLQVRQAYVNIVWPSGWEILVGQTADVISPLVPTTLNYTVAWWAGNIGYRRPQVRVSRVQKLGSVILDLRAAAARTIGDDFGGDDPGDTGTASGVPTVEGLAGLRFSPGGHSISLGAYAHRGRENLGDEFTGSSIDIASSSWGGYLEADFGAVRVSGEMWTGSNLDDYFGGIGEGITIGPDSAIGVSATGGWAQIGLGDGATRAHGGFGIDDPDDDDLAQGSRRRNSTTWGNVIHDFGGGLSVGLEYSYWQTSYVGLVEATSSRVQMSVLYSF